MDMTRDTRCAEAEAIVREQRVSSLAVRSQTWQTLAETNRRELARLQAAVMGESLRGRDKSKSQVEV